MLEKNTLFQLTLSRIRSYLREPEAIFWTYGFPLLMVIGLGVAFQGSGGQYQRRFISKIEGPVEY